MPPDLLSLPRSLHAIGEIDRTGFGKLTMTGYKDVHGVQVYPVWTSERLVESVKSRKPIKCVVAPLVTLVGGLTPTASKQTYLYLDSDRDDAIFVSDSFDVSQLRSDQLIALPKDLPSALVLYSTLMREGGTEVEPLIALQLQEQSISRPNATIDELMHLCFDQQRETLESLENQLASSNSMWQGMMKCNRCNYEWKSKRRTPPARCPKCNSQSITTMMTVDSTTSKSGCALVCALIVIAGISGVVVF